MCIRDSGGILQVQIDEGPKVAFDVSKYNHVSHGYAMTVHKSQGVTVDHTRVLASSSFDKNLSYVALSRHRKSTDVYAAFDEFKKTSLTKVMSRDKTEESAVDFANRHGVQLTDGKFALDPELTTKADAAKDELKRITIKNFDVMIKPCLLYTSPSPRDATLSRMPSSA